MIPRHEAKKTLRKTDGFQLRLLAKIRAANPMTSTIQPGGHDPSLRCDRNHGPMAMDLWKERWPPWIDSEHFGKWSHHPWNDKYPKRAAAEVHAKFCDDDPIGQKILRVEVQKDTGCLHDAQTLNESERHAKSEVSVIIYMTVTSGSTCCSEIQTKRSGSGNKTRCPHTGVLPG